MNNALVEEVAASLVREYLSRKGLKKTISIMDQELPRTNSSVNNRNDLRRVLKLESLYKMNKAQEIPLKAMLEIIVKHCLETQNMTNTRTEDCLFQKNTEPKSRSSVMSSVSVCDISDEEKGGSTAVSNQSKTDVYRKKSTASPKADVLQMKLMKLDDINDEEEFCELSRVPVFSSTSRLNVAAHPIDLNLAVDLKNILFGSSFACFNDEWKIQSFPFNDLPDLRYGIVQKKGGPCGVLASVQACVLQKLLFEETSSSSKSQRLQPSDSHRSKKLALAVADILWRAGDRKKAVVALSSGEKQFIPAGRYKSDGILETIILHTVSSQEDLPLFLEQNIHQFEVGPYGCILLTVSAILSRSTDLVIRDFDVPTNSLIGAHGYCTQELVNLLLTGRAVSNVFNDVIELDSGNGNSTVLNGITGRSDIGLLSLFEHYNLCKVGSYLKSPKYPIWVICSESHFSVLFCVQKELMNDWRMERRFDLYYYDELANQQEEIRLTVDTYQNYVADAENDLIPPIEHCIRTKWNGAVVDWNGAEPLL
ncbi:probable ubiquitin carboxyl-terminal hydrolase MINDY-4 isoform X2 [Acipenser ruthenus]|uniref:probable ubiquitin carboxyl-terminal hydrolase MINDY-4 isoform X2 n=1 Tax=Acipenser ruthenus TaxID=7906 RepID=UPI002740EAD1|nr:probable ubiquitin carboxyl-terminal hydrolase MINDY-4 isoform X2 [Acipenser ruthenus]